MQYHLTTLNNALMVLDDGSFEDQSLQWQVRKLVQQAKEAHSKIEGAQGKLAMVCAFLAFKNRSLTMQLEDLKEEHARLLGNTYEKYMPRDPSEVVKDACQPKPDVQKKTRAPRFIEAELKECYRYVASKCHPDKTTDINLHEFSPIANEAYANHDLDTLRFLKKSVQEYLHMKKNKKRIRDFFRERIRFMRATLEALQEQLNNVVQSRQYTLVQHYESGNFDQASKLYANMIEDSISDLRMQIAQLKRCASIC